MIRLITRREAQQAVRLWHSHHKPQTSDRLRLGRFVGRRLTAVCVIESPVAQALDTGNVFEVSRLAIGPDAPPCAASELLGAAWRGARGFGGRRMVSYTRGDELGTCYLAAGWLPVARVKGRGWTSGNKAGRWLPGLYEPSTEVVDRIRWEIGPDAAPASAAILGDLRARRAACELLWWLFGPLLTEGGVD